jgi:hypothetical protein
MNSIAIEQNTTKQLERLAAQRRLYSTAKRVVAAQAWLAGPIAVAFALLSLHVPSLKGFIALWAILVLVADLAWLTPWQKRLRDSAAKIQELFDCDVLGLPWNDLKGGARPDPELVKEQSDRVGGVSLAPPLENWYSPASADLPIHIARIACQRSNCWWDSNQRRRYAVAVFAATCVIVLTIVGIGMLERVTLEDFIVRALVPIFPILVLGYRQITEQMDAARRVDRLKEHAKRLWEEVVAGMTAAAATRASRNLQDEILESRARSPLVFDFVFRRLRDNFETQMNYGVAQLVDEARVKLGAPLKNPTHNALDPKEG